MKATGGYYYVEPDDAPGAAPVECRARGIFRLEGVAPCVGDIAEVRLDGPGSGTVVAINERRNSLVRPPLANLDYMVVVLSVADPAPNLYITDTFLAVLEHRDIGAVIAVTKSDIGDSAELAAIYELAGYPVHVVSGVTGEGVAELMDRLAGKLCAFSGNSGVGKSSLLNAIDPRFALEVGETSKKLGRGRHTTRHVELFKTQNGTMIADTPGFSSVELSRLSEIGRESLPWCFREFEVYLNKGCRFADCSHTSELGCGVLEALKNGAVGPTRHRSYLQLYDEVKDKKEWEKKT